MWGFIHIPKAAGSSLHKIIGSQPIHYCGHTNPRDMKFFCFVRNPYDRLLDAYAYLMKGGGQTELDLSYQKILQEYESFEDFISNSYLDYRDIIHFYPMTYFTHDVENDWLLIDKVFKIETDMNEIDDFLAGLGYGKLSEVHENVTDIDRSQLTPKAIEKINRLYSRDFELFRYQKLEPEYITY